MTITPVELRHIPLKRGLWGYRRPAVDRLIEEIEQSFEEVWRERADYADRIEQLQAELARHRDLVLQEAHAEARATTRAAASERERLLAEARKIRALLEAALDAAEDASDAQAA